MNPLHAFVKNNKCKVVSIFGYNKAICICNCYLYSVYSYKPIDNLKGSSSKTVRMKDIPEKMNSCFSSIRKEFSDKNSAVSIPPLSSTLVCSKSNAKFQFKTIQVQEIRDQNWLKSKLE